ncbi:MAG TPA: hypothetical protein VF933_17755 [Streptosporangiaceae bacterium]
MTAAIERPEAEHHDPSIRTGKDTRGACYRRECTCGYVGMKMSGTPREGADDRPCPEDRTAVALTTLQFANGGLFDPRPVPGDVTPYAVHLVRVGANGGTPGPRHGSPNHSDCQVSKRPF